MSNKTADDAKLRDLPPAIWVLAIISFCVALGFGIVAPTIPLFGRSFGVSAFAASTVISIFALMRVVSAPFAARFIDRIGERFTLSAGLIMVSVSSALSGLADTFGQLLFMRAAGGLGSSMFTVSAMSLVVRMAPRELRARAVGLYQSGFLIGALFGPAIGGVVLAISLRAPFFFYAGATALAALVAAVLLSKDRTADPEIHDDNAGHESPLRLIDGFRHAGYRAAFTVAAVGGFTIFGLRAAAVPLYVTEQLLEPASLVAYGFFLSALAQGLLFMPASKYADVKGRRPAMLIGSVIMVISAALLLGWETRSGYLLSMAILGFAGAFLSTTPSAIVGDVVEGKRRGPLLAAFQMAGDFGAIVGPLVAGLMVDNYGFSSVFAVGLGATLIGLVVVLMMPKAPTKPAVAS